MASEDPPVVALRRSRRDRAPGGPPGIRRTTARRRAAERGRRRARRWSPAFESLGGDGLVDGVPERIRQPVSGGHGCQRNDDVDARYVSLRRMPLTSPRHCPHGRTVGGANADNDTRSVDGFAFHPGTPGTRPPAEPRQPHEAVAQDRDVVGVEHLRRRRVVEPPRVEIAVGPADRARPSRDLHDGSKAASFRSTASACVANTRSRDGKLARTEPWRPATWRAAPG